MFNFLLKIINEMSLFVGYLKNGTIDKALTKDEEEYYTSLLYTKNHDEAREKLIRHNLRLVIHIAKKYEGCGEDNEDLISIGVIGLIKAVDTFSPSKEVKISTYAARCIDNEILMHIRANKKYYTNASVGDSIGMDKDGSSITLLDILPSSEPLPDEILNKKIKLEKLIKFAPILDEKEKEIISLRYGINNQRLTQKEVAKKYKISRSYVSRIEKRALTKLLNEFKKEEN